MTRLYVAGPMTGKPRWNFGAFADASSLLRGAGYDVSSPAEHDLEAGFNPDAPVAEFTNDDLRAALKRDAVLVLEADGVATLPGWEASAGARAEVALAFAAGIMVQPVAQWYESAGSAS